MEPVPQNSRSGEGHRMVARRRSGLSTMTKPSASWRWGCISPILVQRLLRLQATRVDGEHGQECTQLHTSGCEFASTETRGPALASLMASRFCRYGLGHGDARYAIAHLLVETPRPGDVAEHVQL